MRLPLQVTPLGHFSLKILIMQPLLEGVLSLMKMALLAMLLLITL